MTKTGTVTYYNDEKGYGFVTMLMGNTLDDADAFFHISDYPNNHPQEGDRLKFRAVKNDKGWRAENIKLESRPKKQKTSKKDSKRLRVREIDPEYEKKTGRQIKKSKKAEDGNEVTNPFKNNTSSKNDLL